MPIRERLQFEDVEGVRVGRVGWGLNTVFVVYRIGDVLIDTGPSNQWRPVRSFVSELPPRRLLLTHHHEDHSGNAARLAKLYDLLPEAPEASRDKLRRGYRTPPMQRFIWGSPRRVEAAALPERIDLPAGDPLIPIHTPGHSKDHHCLFRPECRALFTGDLFLSRRLTHMRIDEDLAVLMQSLADVLKLDFDVALCSHRGVAEDGRSAMADKLAFLKQLCADARRLHDDGVPEGDAVRRLLGPEDAVSHLSRYNISKRNLYRQAVQAADAAQPE